MRYDTRTAWRGESGSEHVRQGEETSCESASGSWVGGTMSAFLLPPVPPPIHALIHVRVLADDIISSPRQNMCAWCDKSASRVSREG